MIYSFIINLIYILFNYKDINFIIEWQNIVKSPKKKGEFFMDDNILELLEDWEKGVRIKSIAHSELAARNRTMSSWFGIVGIIISAVITFSTILSKYSFYPWVQGSLGLVSTLILSILKFFKFTESAESHKVASINYGNLRRNIETTMVMIENEKINLNLEKTLQEIEAEWSTLDKSSPIIPEKVYNKAYKRVSVLDKSGKSTAIIPSIA